VSGRGIISVFIYIVTLIWLSVRVGLGILILISNIKREITAEGEIGLFNLMIAGGSLCLTGTEIDEGRD